MDEFDIIETPENVDLQRRLAGIGSRFAAGLLDHLVITALFVLLILLFLVIRAGFVTVGRSVLDEVGAVVTALMILAGFLVYWGYFAFFEMWMNGQTPGKKYMRIRVVRLEGGAITFDAIAVRNLVRVADAFCFYGVAGIAMFLTKKVQRLGDLAAGTVVISEEVADYSAKYDSKQRVLDDQPAPAAALASTRLSPQEYRLLHNYWLRRDQLTLDARQRLLPQLLQPILGRMGHPLSGESLPAMERQLEELMMQAGTLDSSAGGPAPAGEGDR
ncbi:MAG: RDD family protein [Phycisphaerales bacterium]